MYSHDSSSTKFDNSFFCVCYCQDMFCIEGNSKKTRGVILVSLVIYYQLYSKFFSNPKSLVVQLVIISYIQFTRNKKKKFTGKKNAGSATTLHQRRLPVQLYNCILGSRTSSHARDAGTDAAPDATAGCHNHQHYFHCIVHAQRPGIYVHTCITLNYISQLTINYQVYRTHVHTRMHIHYYYYLVPTYIEHVARYRLVLDRTRHTGRITPQHYHSQLSSKSTHSEYTQTHCNQWYNAQCCFLSVGRY